MVVESKVADAFILLIIIADVREAGKSGDAVLEIGTTHTIRKESIGLFFQKRGYT